MTVDHDKVRSMLREDLIAALRRRDKTASQAQLRRQADQLIALANEEGRKIRVLARDRKIRHLRTELAERARCGAYPKLKWAKLRELEEQARAET